MQECAFCNHEGKLSAEHIISQWIGDMLPPGQMEAWYLGGTPKRESRFVTDKIDWKARVVCESCNNGWMSDIEGKVQPILTPLIRGEIGALITPEKAGLISLFAAIKAIVIDCANRRESLFFSKRIRHALRHGNIPPSSNIWVCGYADPESAGQVYTTYHKSPISPSNYRHMYACTCSYGGFAFQLLSVKDMRNARFMSISEFGNVAIPLWPSIPPDLVWPGYRIIEDQASFVSFAQRWSYIRLLPGE